MGKRGHKSYPTMSQLQNHMIVGVCNSDGVAVSGDEGSEEIITARSATGIYTLTLRTPFNRKLTYCGVTPETEDLTWKTTISGSVATVTFANLSGTDTNTKFRYFIVGNDDIVRRG